MLQQAASKASVTSSESILANRIMGYSRAPIAIHQNGLYRLYCTNICCFAAPLATLASSSIIMCIARNQFSCWANLCALRLPA